MKIHIHDDTIYRINLDGEEEELPEHIQAKIAEVNGFASSEWFIQEYDHQELSLIKMKVVIK